MLAVSLMVPIVSSGVTAELNITGPDDLVIYVEDPINGFYDRKVLSPVNLGSAYTENLGANPQDPAGFIFRYKLKIPKVHGNQTLRAVRAIAGIIDTDGNPVVGKLKPTGNQGGVSIDPTTVDEVPVVDFWVCVDDPGEIDIEYARAGPEIDVFRAKVIKSPDAQLIAMLSEGGVVLTDILRTGDIEKLDDEGFTVTSAPGFHMGHIGYNIRPNRDYLTPPYSCNPDAAYVLSDVNFRHALFHFFNREGIVSSIHGYVVTPIQSLVPPAQGGWVNPTVPLHQYNPGSKTATTEYNPATGDNEDACSILRYGGYLYDPGLDNWVTPYDIDGDGTPGTNHPDRPLVVMDPDDVAPPVQLWTPVGPCGQANPLADRFVDELNGNGLTSIVHWPREFSPYLDDVEIGDFDMYMLFWSVGRFPDHLYYMCHSDCDPIQPSDGWRIYNFPGIHDPELDEAVGTIVTSLDHMEKVAAAYEAQNILYNESHPLAAFSYMQLYSRNYFNAFNPDLRSIINSPGYGSDNSWTHMNLNWAPGTERTEGGETIIEWIWDEEPELLNPCFADTIYAWDIIDKTLDSLITVDPFTHEDMSWLAEDWTVDEWPNQGPNGESWMNVTFWLRKDVFWQDGNPFTASDVEFSWKFLRDNTIPRYIGLWQFLEDAVVIDNYTVRAVVSAMNQFLLYDLADTAALLPPQVWDWLNGEPLTTIMEYDPTANTTSTGPWFGLGTGFASTHLFGTGPFVFESYNPNSLVADLHQSVSYYLTSDEISDLKTEMFHKIGDVDRDGEIGILDLSRQALAYFTWPPNPLYDADADVNSDGIVDMRDIALTACHYGEQREFPKP